MDLHRERHRVQLHGLDLGDPRSGIYVFGAGKAYFDSYINAAFLHHTNKLTRPFEYVYIGLVLTSAARAPAEFDPAARAHLPHPHSRVVPHDPSL